MEEFKKIREGFYEFLDDEQIYNKFVRHLNCSNQGKLLFKQELHWNNFKDKYLNRDYGFSEIQEIFRVCEVHNVELVKGTVELRQGHLDYTRDYEQASAKLFPYACISPFFVWDTKGQSVVDVWYCPKCRVAKASFNEQELKQVNRENT